MTNDPKKQEQLDILLEEFLSDAARDKRNGITLGALYRAVRDGAQATAALVTRVDRLEKANTLSAQRADRHGRRLKTVEKKLDVEDELETTGQRAIAPDELEDALEVRTAFEAKRTLDEQMREKREADKWLRRALIAAAISLAVSAVAGCTAYVASRVSIVSIPERK